MMHVQPKQGEFDVVVVDVVVFLVWRLEEGLEVVVGDQLSIRLGLVIMMRILDASISVSPPPDRVQLGVRCDSHPCRVGVG